MDDQRLEYRAWLASDRGCVRPGNEDTCGISTAPNDLPLTHWSGELPANGGWAVVADGMGGHAAGEVASQIAVECLRSLAHLLTTSAGVEAALAATNDALFDVMAEDETLSGMGTTVAGASLSGASVLAFNIGDSRIYVQGHHLFQVSEDHVIGGHMLTRCLGGTARRHPVMPFVETLNLTVGDRLLICSDGLTDMVDDTEINALLRSKSENPAEALVTAAIEAGGHDNVSVIVIERTR